MRSTNCVGVATIIQHGGGDLVAFIALTLVAAVAAGLLQTAQAVRALIQPSRQEGRRPLGPTQYLGSFACGPPIRMLHA